MIRVVSGIMEDMSLLRDAVVMGDASDFAGNLPLSYEYELIERTSKRSSSCITTEIESQGLLRESTMVSPKHSSESPARPTILIMVGL